MQMERHERHDGVKRSLRGGELFAIVAFWAFLAILTAAGRLLDPRTPADETFSRGLVTLAFIEYSIWAALTVPIFYMVGRISGRERGRAEQVLVFLVIGLIIAIGVDSLLAAFRLHLLGPPRFGRGSLSGLRNIIRLEFLDDFLVYIAILAAALARDYFLRYQARQVETE